MSEVKPPKTSPAALQYFLILYNAVSATLWSVVLGRVLTIGLVFGLSRVYSGTGNFLRWTQTLAILEIIFSATGTLHRELFSGLSKDHTAAGDGISIRNRW